MSTGTIGAFADDMLGSTGCDVVWPKMISMEQNFLKFLDIGSAQALGVYNQENLNILGDKASTYTSELFKSVGSITPVPYAFGIGALILSMFLDLALSTAKKTPSAESVLLSVFAQEKVSEVRDLVDAYTKRWKANIMDSKKLIEETRRYEQLLSDQLTRVRNSVLRDDQGNVRSVRVWMHGAAFHVHMNIYQEALTGHQNYTILSYIDDYIRDAEDLLEKYKTFRKDSFSIRVKLVGQSTYGAVDYISIKGEDRRIQIHSTKIGGYVEQCKSEILDRYLEKMYVRCPLPSAFSDFLRNTSANLNTLLWQNGSFWIN
ncbi:hypothetical protein NDU88_000774 [Pleurodeles waltl]|uniref:Uncharacterized protein n=1 Tax=Pleurodeles waltl TaxID=8319 RepID=A0AAV7RB02_PLEWA|nr:hypothetical protein NDU88_000774 [Pleurodeles waltl]